MKLQLLSTDRGMKSKSLKRIAEELSSRLHYKVFRTTQVRGDRKQLRYGHQMDKLGQYEYFRQKEISSFTFTTDRNQAQAWVNEGKVVFGRKTLVGSQGAGIVICSTKPGDLAIVPTCRVYTLYIPKKREFRVHIFRNHVVGIVEKRKRQEHDGPSDSRVRNLANGYVFCQTVELTAALRQKIEEVALKARKLTRSDFAGIDVGYNQANNNVFVIEVNSAPGIEGSNVNHYCDAIVAEINNA